MPARVYLDHNATAPLRPEAREAMIAAMDVVGNPSSVHAEGRAAKAVVERARGQVAELCGCKPGEVVFTSGATEAASVLRHVRRKRYDRVVFLGDAVGYGASPNQVLSWLQSLGPTVDIVRGVSTMRDDSVISSVTTAAGRSCSSSCRSIRRQSCSMSPRSWVVRITVTPSRRQISRRVRRISRWACASGAVSAPLSRPRPASARSRRGW